MTPTQIWIGMWVKILKIFFPAVIFFIVGLAYIYVDEWLDRNKKEEI